MMSTQSGCAMTAENRDLYRQWIEQLWNGPSSADQLKQVAADHKI